MKHRRVRLEHRAVPQGYEPGYPADLSPAEYRELILASTHRRATRLALAAGALASCGASAQEPAPASREARLLALIRELHTDAGASWYSATTFTAEGASARGGVVPSIPISFGNSHNGLFDSGRARELGLKLFAIYGLSAQKDVRIEVGDGAVLDGYDPARRVGFELRGRAPTASRMFAEPEEEPTADGLDAEEQRALEQQDLRVLVADLARFPLMDGDQFTPTLAWLAGIVAFLNEVTEGPDIDLSALLFRRAQRFPLPGPAELTFPEGVSAREERGHLELLVERAATVRIDFGGDGAAPPLPERETRMAPAPTEPLDAPLATGGAPTVLQFVDVHDPLDRAQPPGGAPLRLRLVQGELVVEAKGATVFAPSAFEAARPFALELRLAPGSHLFWSGYLLVGVPAR